MSEFKPMLADDANLNALQFPLLASPKLDGVRASVVDKKLLTRSLKPLPNRYIQGMSIDAPLDGELIVGDPTSPSVFRDTMKVVMAHDEPVDDLRYFVFDLVNTSKGFADRLMSTLNYCDGQRIIHLPHVVVQNFDDLLRIEEAALDNGYEGLMVRDPNGPYKFGRATAREGYLLKVKRKKTSEAMILNFVEQMHNANEAKIDNLGYMERSSHQANLVPMGTLGALIVRDLTTGVEFNVGTGFDAQLRKEIWLDQARYRGSIITYEFLPVGVKDKPRHPVFKGFRSVEDMSK